MEALDSTTLAARLHGQANEYWLHLEAEGPMEKYPGKQHNI
jgi:Xaa-Pro dipeptidase